MKNKNLLLVMILIVVLFNSIVYSALNSEMFINGDAHIRVDKDIRITDVKVVDQVNGAYETYNSDYSKNTTSMQVTLPSSESFMIYEVTITNKGDTDYEVTNIVEESYSNSNIKYELIDINKGTVIDGGITHTFKIKFTTTENNPDNKTTLVLKYTFEEWIPSLYNMVAHKSRDLDTDIDFGVAPTIETSGVYEMNNTKDDKYPVYYYRGIVDDNNVSFAGFCWKIVRTTSTGGVKLIYNGVPASDGSCNNTGISTQIATEQFNSGMRSASDNGYMHGINYDFSFRGNFSGAGYVYGNDVKWDGTKYTLVNTMTSSSWSSDRITIGTSYHYTCLNNSNTCTTVYYVNYVGFTNEINYLILSDGKNIDDARNEMFSNEIDSNIKTKIDEWYSNNMLEYSDMLEDTIWCNDRSIYEGTLKGKDSPSSGKSTNIFGPFGRIGYNNSYNPIITCPNKNDSFTVSSESGNGALKYPIALLTIDELVLSGLQAKSYNTSSYLFSDTDWFTMSPRADFHTTVFAASQKNWQYASYISGVRPSISIVSGTMIADGNGSVTNPYKLSNHS